MSITLFLKFVKFLLYIIFVCKNKLLNPKSLIIISGNIQKIKVKVQNKQSRSLIIEDKIIYKFKFKQVTHLKIVFYKANYCCIYI